MWESRPRCAAATAPQRPRATAPDAPHPATGIRILVAETARDDHLMIAIDSGLAVATMDSGSDLMKPTAARSVQLRCASASNPSRCGGWQSAPWCRIREERCQIRCATPVWRSPDLVRRLPCRQLFVLAHRYQGSCSGAFSAVVSASSS